MKIHRFLSLVLVALLLPFAATSVYGQSSNEGTISSQSQSAVMAATVRTINSRLDFAGLSFGGAQGFAFLDATNGTMLAQSSDCNPCSAICGGAKGKNAAWVNYLGITDEVPGSTVDINTDGIQIGTDIYRTKDNQFGVTFAYTGTKAYDDGYLKHTNTNGYNLSLYGAHRFSNQADLRLIVNSGWLDGNNKDPDGVEDNHNFSGDSFDTTLEYGKRFFVAKNVSFRPAVALDYHYYDIDNVFPFSETYFRIGTDYVTMLKHLSLKMDVSYSIDLNGEPRLADIGGGDINPMSSSDELGRQFTTLGLTAQYDLRKNFALYASYSLDYFFDRNGRPCRGIGTVGLSWVW
jgi:uncharacterized protein with beta-barrel porin domain